MVSGGVLSMSGGVWIMCVGVNSESEFKHNSMFIDMSRSKRYLKSEEFQTIYHSTFSSSNPKAPSELANIRNSELDSTTFKISTTST